MFALNIKMGKVIIIVIIISVVDCYKKEKREITDG